MYPSPREDRGAHMGLCSVRGRAWLLGHCVQTECEPLGWRGVQDLRFEGSVMGMSGVLGT